MTNDLVERVALIETVARCICTVAGEDTNEWEKCADLAEEIVAATVAASRPRIRAIALEEAAKVVRIALEEHGDPLATEAADRAIRELIEVCP
jgi:hypothetical protein